MKNSLIFLVLLAGLSQQALAFGSAPPPSTVTPVPLSYDYLPGVNVVMGMGFSLPRNDTSQVSTSQVVCLDTVKNLDNPNRYISQGMELHEQIISSTQELKTALGIDAQMDASYLAYSGSAKYDFTSDEQVDESSLNILIQGSADYGPDEIDVHSVKLAPNVQQLIDNGRIDEFKSMCGTQFVSELRYGTKVSLLLSFHNASEQLKESVSADLSASGSFGLAHGSVSTALNQMLQSSSSSSEVDMTVIVHGGDGLPDLDTLVASLLTTGQDMSELEQGVKKLFDSLTPRLSAVSGFGTTPYPGIPWNGEDLMSDEKEEMLGRIVDNYRYESARFDRVQNLYDQFDRSGTLPTDFDNAPIAIISSARPDLPRLDNYITQLAVAHSSCMSSTSSDLSSCALPPIVPIANFNALWRFLPPS